MKGAIVLFLFAALFVTGCDKVKMSATQPTTASIEQPVRVNGPVLAKVNNWAIGVDDFNSYLEILKTQNLNVDVTSPEFKQELLNRLVNNQILAEVAMERGVDRDEEVQKALRNYKSTLLAEKVTGDLEKNVEVSFAEVKDFYEKNKQMLVKPKQLKIREIVVATEDEAKNASIRVLQGEDFAAVAQSVSIAPSAKNGGLLEGAKDGYISLDQQTVQGGKFMKFWETAAGLGKGEKSGNFKGDDGKWYLVKVDDIREGQEVPLTEVQKDLEQGLKVDKTMKEINKLIEEYKTKAKVEVNQDLIK